MEVTGIAGQRIFTSSPLDEIEGIGLIRKRTLLAKFGSAKAISTASRDDLRLVQGISEAMANAIYNHFRE